MNSCAIRSGFFVLKLLLILEEIDACKVSQLMGFRLLLNRGSLDHRYEVLANYLTAKNR